MVKTKPGAFYVGSGRRFVDSQALHNIAHTHELVQSNDGGWRVLGVDGAVACSLLGGQDRLPGQRGALYEVSAEPGVLVPMARAWAERGHIDIHEIPPEWHKAPRASCGGCGTTCACGPCQHKHGPASIDDTKPPHRDPHGR